MKSKIHLGISLLNLGVIIFFATYYFLSEHQEIVYVDSNKLINGYQGMIEARKAYQQKTLRWKANIDTLASEVENQIKNHEREIGKMTAKEKVLSAELINTKKKQLYEYQQALQAQAEEEDNNMTTEVMTKINGYIKQHGEDKGYTIILAATEYGNLAFADEALDITNEVLVGLNKQYNGQ